MHLQTVAKRTVFIWGYCLLLLTNTSAQRIFSSDTLRLERKELEQLFLQKNLQLIAAGYEVAADKALILQAKLWDNPELSTDQNLYANQRFFEHRKDASGAYQGQYFVQLQQLVKTGGKRKREIQLSKTNAEITEWQFRELMQALKLMLRSDFYKMSQLLSLHDLYEQELEQLDKLEKAMQVELKLGNIAQKDLLRVQALQLMSRQSRVENSNEIERIQSELRTLLQIEPSVFIKPTIPQGIELNHIALNIDSLFQLAKENKATYRIQKLQLNFQQQNLALQKALAIPDLNIGPSFDRNGGYTPNYVGLGISLPLPVFNRNQGNIKSAYFRLREEETLLLQAEIELKNSLANAIHRYQLLHNAADTSARAFYNNYKKLYESIAESYRQRRISLIEFIDYFQTYKEIKETAALQQLNLYLAQEDLNYQVGTNVLP